MSGDWGNYVVEAELGAGNWVDATSFVDTEQSQISIQTGKRTETDGAEPSSATLTLNNSDHRWTVGNPLAPPPWDEFRQGCRFRISEVLGYRRFVHLTGRVEAPEIDDWAEAGADQFITVTLVDRLTEADTSRTFVSTLAEYIMFTSAGTLRAYYPLSETRGPFRDIIGGQPPMELYLNPSTLARSVSLPFGYTPGGGTPPPGDDLRPLLFSPAYTPVGNINQYVNGWGLRAEYRHTAAVITAAAADPLTVICWVTMDSNYLDIQEIFTVNMFDHAVVPTPLQLFRDAFDASGFNQGFWDGNIFNGSSYTGAEIFGNLDRGGRPVPVALQWTYSPASLKMWIDAREYTGTPTGTLSQPVSLIGRIGIGPIAGSVSHFQIHVGPYSRADFLAQRDAGMTGLAGQYAGDRIRTIAQYAGVAATDLSRVEQGSTRMAMARLAGQTALPQMRLAETAEQGRLRSAGDGGLIFDSRRTRYNI